jgi:hypothetical protein
MASNNRGIAVSEQDRQRGPERAAYHRARLARMDDETRLDYVADVFASCPHVAGLVASPSTRDTPFGDPLVVILKGGDALLAGGRTHVVALEIVPCDDGQQAMMFARLFGGPLANGHFAICQRLPH